MDTVLARLVMPECGQPEYDPRREEWNFECGLVLTDRFASTVPPQSASIGFTWTHRHHHQQGHTYKSWQVIIAAEEDMDAMTISYKFSCTCSDYRL